MTSNEALTVKVNDEETPLLPKNPKATPLPWFQLAILLCVQFAEPLISRGIVPFTPQLIRDIGVTHGDESKVGYYVGFLESLFFLAQACTVLYHSKISDHVGRKPMILFGLLGLALPMYTFGLSKHYPGLALSRAMNGALDGNIGVMKSIVVEITDSTNISKAFAYMNIAYSTGSTLGPLVGGSLSHPVERFPSIFGGSQFHKQYPYFLPCAVTATFCIACFLLVYLHLNETAQSRTSLSRIFKDRKPNAAASDGIVAATVHEGQKPLPLRSLLTYRVLVSAGNYATLALVDVCYLGVQVLFFATPIELGGLGLNPQIIGNILSCFTTLDVVAQFFFPKIYGRLGSKNTFLCGVLGCFPLVAMFPLMNHLARVSSITNGLPWSVWALIGLQVFLSLGISYSYGTIAIYISSSPPNSASVGAVNGLAQTTVSLTRAVGPAAISSLFSYSIEHKYLGGYLVYVVLTGLICVATINASVLPRQVWRV